jgi:polyhydroxyalkanoate synthesis regulator phasin
MLKQERKNYMEQLLLFHEPEEEKNDRKIQSLEEKYDRLRKSQHARITMLQNEIKDLKSELEFLKGNICKGKLFL